MGLPVSNFKKKDGGLRICGDYKTTKYPIANVEQALNCVVDKKTFSKIALKSANHLRF